MVKLISKQAWAQTIIILVDQLVFTMEKNDCLTFCSKSGGINAEILVKLLMCFDENSIPLDSWRSHPYDPCL